MSVCCTAVLAFMQRKFVVISLQLLSTRLCPCRWFHDTLVDGDLAINSMMWQNAGKSGLDQWNFTLLPTSTSQVVHSILMYSPRLRRLIHVSISIGGLYVHIDVNMICNRPCR